MNLTKEDIEILIQICNSIQVRVDQSPQIIAIIQKLQKGLTEPKEQKEKTPS